MTVTLEGGGAVRVDLLDLFMLAFQGPLDRPPPAAGRTFRAPRGATAVDVALSTFGWTSPPQAYFAAMTASTKPLVRMYALMWLACEVSGEIDIDAIVARLSNDPDPGVGNVAARIRDLRASLFPRP